MDNLSLDHIEVDTALAEEYIKKYNNFDDWPQFDKYWLVKNYPNREEHDFIRFTKTVPNVKENELSIGRGIQLAKKIIENEKLFTQLEYFIRKTDAADVKNNIKLLCQHLQCYDEFSLWLSDVSILMTEKTPLYTLGCVSCLFSRRSNETETTLHIATTKKTAPLCHLFTELCAQVGWTIPLVFVCDLEDYKKCNILRSLPYAILFIECANEESGCTAVVTESADIDSALDLFINSSVTAPWKLKHIYIQESIYDEVKSVLAWKCSRVAVDACVDAFAAKGKVFLCDSMSAAAVSEAPGHAVQVCAYRTALEARALIAQGGGAPFLSVWAADTASSHELALSSSAVRVWINEYAAFDDPPRASLPVYEKIYTVFQPHISYDENLSAVTGTWAKLTENERVDFMLSALQDHLASVPLDFPRVERLQDAIRNRRDDGFVSVNGDRICFGVGQTQEFAVIDVKSDNRLNDLVNLIIRSNTVYYSLYEGYEEFAGLFEALEKIGVPIKGLQSTCPPIYARFPVINKKIKVVSTNFGTNFAN